MIATRTSVGQQAEEEEGGMAERVSVLSMNVKIMISGHLTMHVQKHEYVSNKTHCLEVLSLFSLRLHCTASVPTSAVGRTGWKRRKCSCGRGGKIRPPT